MSGISSRHFQEKLAIYIGCKSEIEIQITFKLRGNYTLYCCIQL